MAEKKLSGLDILSLVSDNMQDSSTAPKIEIEQTSQYERWLARLRDAKAKWRILAYFEKVRQTGDLHGDYKAVGDHVTEVRFDMGPGYRVYLTKKDREWLLLLVGGNKSSQERDIKKAKNLAKKWRMQREGN